MAKKKKWLPRQENDKLGRKAHLVILSKKDKDRNNRHKGENRRKYLHEDQHAGFFIYMGMLNHEKIITKMHERWVMNFSGLSCLPAEA